jgi:predicted nucleic acid-binding protein
MNLNPSIFNTLNVIDSCSIWNILSSKILRQATKTAKCVFCCTQFVQYECLHKPRKSIPNDNDKKLIERLNDEQNQGNFTVYSLDIEQLLEIDILEKRKNLGKGELSSIAFAKITNQAFLTDDYQARILANNELKINTVQTTPHLFGWLMYESILNDSDKDAVVKELREFKRLDEKRRLKTKFFDEMYNKALEYRLKNNYSRVT